MQQNDKRITMQVEAIGHPIITLPTAKVSEVINIERDLGARGYGGTRKLTYFAIKHIARRELPYGKWTCQDGRVVVFNREYQPILQRKNGVLSYADRNEQVGNIVEAEMFYHDGNDPSMLLTRHLGFNDGTHEQQRDCRMSLLRCLRVLREFTPPEHYSVSHAWSLLK